MKARPAGLVHAVTLGCPRNRVDTEVMLGDLLSHGYGLTTSVRQADVVLVNTCGFLREAREESLEVLREMARRMRPGARLVAAGCMAQVFAAQIRAAVPEVELLSGVRELLRLRGRLEGASRAGPGAMPSAQNPRLVTSCPGSAYLKVSEGCNRRCSFCIIPRIRGRQRSRPLEDLRAETRSLIGSGIREVVLVAEDLSAWGRDLPDRPGLAALVEGVAGEMPQGTWLRLMYVYPSGIEDRLLDLLAEHPVVLPYLDMPVQHGDDGVLGAMRRGTRARGLRRLVERVRERVPGVVMRTTFLVGHPGEDGPAFERLLAFADEMAFEMAGAFAWSPEPGSHAVRLPGAVPQAERIRRKEVLEQVLAEAALRSRSRLLDQPHEALVEEVTDRSALGRAWFQAPEVDGRLRIHGGRPAEGRQVVVRVRTLEGNDFTGKVLASGRPDRGREGRGSPAVQALPAALKKRAHWPSRVRGLVLDLDGTLVDSFGDLREAVNHVRGLRGLPPLDREAVMARVGHGARHLVRETTEPADEEQTEGNLRGFLEYYQAHLLVHTRPYPGVPEALKRLREAGIGLAVLTNKPISSTRRILEGLGLAPLFEAVRGGDSGPAMKPDPEALRALLAETGWKADEVLLVGDSDVDLETGSRAGVPAVRVHTGLWRSCRRTPDLEVESLEALLLHVLAD